MNCKAAPAYQHNPGFDASGFGMGLRAQRFALYADDGVVRKLQIEAPGEFKVSSAEAMLKAIS